jgi:hypothetical protein
MSLLPIIKEAEEEEEAEEAEWQLEEVEDRISVHLT